MPYVLGIDVSTTATKAVVIDGSGGVVAVGSVEYGFDVPQPGWTEQDPALWWNGAVGSIRQALAASGVAGSEVAAVGLTGQMHGLVLLDTADRVLRPAILWNDQRTAHACDEIREALGLEELEQRVADGSIDPRRASGQQELLENLVNRGIWAADR